MILRIRPRKPDANLVEVALYPDYEFADVVRAIDQAVAENRPFSVLNRVGTELTFDPSRCDAFALVTG